MSTPTTVFEFDKPTVGADVNSWGALLNGNFDTLDKLLPFFTAEHLGAVGDGVTDDSTALQALCDDCLSTGRRGVANGLYNIGSATITDRTSGLIDWSQTSFTTTAGGQAVPAFVVAPATADTFSTDDAAGASKTLADNILADVNTAIAAGKFKAGVLLISELAGYKGKSFWVNTTQLHIDRVGVAGSYRYEFAIHVIDDEGHLLCPFPFDVPTSIVMVNCGGQTVEKRASVALPRILVASGSTDRTAGLVQIERSGTTLLGGEVINNTTTTLPGCFNFPQVTDVACYNLHAQGANEASTGYGFGAGTCSAISFYDCTAVDCRRGFDSTYGHGFTFNNCRFPDGLGGHWFFDTTVFGGSIGCDAPNAAPLNIAGGNIVLKGTKLTRETTGAMVSIRPDVTEFRGQIILDDVDMTWDYTGETGTKDATVLIWNYPGSSHDFGRTVHLPDLIEISGTARVLGTGHTSRVIIINHSDGANVTSDIQVDTDVYAEKLKLVFENGTPTARVGGVRRANWTGPGIRFNLKNFPDLTVYWGALSGHADDTAARAVWNVQADTVNFRTDGEATLSYDIDCLTFTTSDAVGATSLVGDEQWYHRINGGLQTRLFGGIADDDFVSFAAPADYAIMLVTQRAQGNGGMAAQFTADAIGGPGALIHFSTGETVDGVATALTGTTGTDGNVTIGATASPGTIYIENRTDATLEQVIVTYLSGSG